MKFWPPSVYGVPIRDAGLGKPPSENFVEKMKQIVDVVNRFVCVCVCVCARARLYV